MIVDDNEVNVAVLEELLEDDYELSCVLSGEAAIAAAPAFMPDMLLLDVMMPGMDGYATCRWFRAHETLSDTLVVLMSANAMADDKETGLQSGADVYITKPFNLRTLAETIAEMLSSARVKTRSA